MANTLKKIQTITVGSGGASSIEFTSIPQTYTDLKLVVSLRTGTSGVEAVLIEFNGSSSNLSGRRLYGDGQNPTSDTLTNIRFAINTASETASVFANGEIYIPNYTSSNNKSVSIDGVSENNGTSAIQSLVAGLWSNSAAITSIKLTGNSSGTFAQYSTATLYGISNVTAAGNAYATGGIITYDDTYVYHTFPWSGTFTPTRALTVDYLVVAGGGGGGTERGGGGGAGGLRCTVTATGGGGSLESALSLTASTDYTVTVGGGGAGAGNDQTIKGTNGSNSVFSTITSTGGGGGGSRESGVISGATGGSGGGAASNGDVSQGSGAAGTANQGYAGGNGTVSNSANGGGGGGASAVGSQGTTTTASGTGGAGVATSISGTSTTYAGGGGGGAAGSGKSAGSGGAGGGGTGGVTTGTNATAGTANTGGGGGGGGDGTSTGAAGGSGIVIVRYAR